MMLTRVTVLLALGLLCYLEGAAGQDDQDDYPKHVNCPGVYAPVCGTNGKTYHNVCFLKAENRKSMRTIRVRHRGPCQDDDLHES
ncbi:serine protease inhibitor Kazal-type 1 [Alligator mississippiensis]|uniref:Pancreatic secretory trypsin inhibitor-like n=1 Tax=Alligator mississippiensis TaxID=8496 RepID=A0A151MEI5_ALLMI|nr:serine protease inhibitor Kazal-type 1 [Alligator mississippiensis]KYO22913.1 pancreatic secretory trypsin inhibitor-like [Alligator mississippiensis]